MSRLGVGGNRSCEVLAGERRGLSGRALQLVDQVGCGLWAKICQGLEHFRLDYLAGIAEDLNQRREDLQPADFSKHLDDVDTYRYPGTLRVQEAIQV